MTCRQRAAPSAAVWQEAMVDSRGGRWVGSAAQSAVCSADLVTTTTPGRDVGSDKFIYVKHYVWSGMLSPMGALTENTTTAVGPSTRGKVRLKEQVGNFCSGASRNRQK